MIRRFFPILALVMSCDDLKGAAEDCTDVCTKVSDCGVEGPSAQIGNMTSDEAPAEVDCGVNCIQDDRAYYGYSDCQMTCIVESDCDKVADCWKANSETYAEFCLSDRDTVPIEPGDDDAQSDNGTTTGSTDADDITEDPAVMVAVEDGDYDINYGDTPPDITGEYDVYGTIYESMNARPEGSLIDTTICFWGQTTLSDGTEATYCEHGVEGEPTAPITGSGDDFTVYLEYEGLATILFSGTVDGDGHITESEALVVYLYGVDVWEQSHTTWTYTAECDGC